MNKKYNKIAIVMMAFCMLILAAEFVCAENTTPFDQNTPKEQSKTISNKVSKIENLKKAVIQETPIPTNGDNSWTKVSSLINTFSTAILAFLTLVYVFLTFRILSEMRASREPAIEIDFEVKVNALHETFVWVKNAGLSPAKNIHIDVDDNLPLSHLYELKDTTLSEANFIKNDIPYLAPGRSKTYVVGNLKLNRDIWKATDYIVKFSVNFENIKSRKHNVKMSVDVLQCIDPVVFRGQESLGPGYEVRIDKEP